MAEDVSIRTAALQDESNATALIRASYRVLMAEAYGQSYLDALLPVIGKANPRLLASGTYYLAVRAVGELVGAGGWTRERPGTGDILPAVGHVRHFATHPDWAGKGVGRSIMERCLREAEAAGCRRMDCQASLNAVDFYRKLGFNVVKPIDVPVKGKAGLQEDLIMKCMLMERLF